jgi:hypothetical protein
MFFFFSPNHEHRDDDDDDDELRMIQTRVTTSTGDPYLSAQLDFSCQNKMTLETVEF